MISRRDVLAFVISDFETPDLFFGLHNLTRQTLICQPSMLIKRETYLLLLMGDESAYTLVGKNLQ